MTPGYDKGNDSQFGVIKFKEETSLVFSLVWTFGQNLGWCSDKAVFEISSIS